MSLIFCLMSIGLMSHVGFKKWLCRPGDFKGQGPHCYWLIWTCGVLVISCGGWSFYACINEVCVVMFIHYLNTLRRDGSAFLEKVYFIETIRGGQTSRYKS